MLFDLRAYSLDRMLQRKRGAGVKSCELCAPRQPGSVELFGKLPSLCQLNPLRCGMGETFFEGT